MGNVLSLLFATKTMWGAHALGGSVIWGVLPRAAQGDPEAIGQIVLAVGGWLLTAYGRWHAKGPMKP